MRRFALVFAMLAGCSHQVHSITSKEAVLGRVVIYRNGVAFYERRARVVDGKVTVLVPRDRVDDFLKSLTVVDPITRKPLAVSIPRQETERGSYLTMTLETDDKARAEVLLTYVTESPAWKPSYRVVVGDRDKVMLEGWAIVDNVSGEDWKHVLVGVGASSALSFRYDLWSVRHIDRDLLQGDAQFAVAPPTGMSPYAGESEGEQLVTLSSDELRSDLAGSASLQNTYVVDGVNTSGVSSGARLIGAVTDSRTGEKLAGVTVIATSPGKPTLTVITDEQGAYRLDAAPGTYDLQFYYGDVTVQRTGVQVVANRSATVYQKLDGQQQAGERITLREGSAASGITIDSSMIKNIPIAGRTFDTVLGSVAGSQTDATGASVTATASPPPVRTGDAKLADAARRILADKKHVVIAAAGPTDQVARQRAEAVKNRLVDVGIPADRIHVRTETGRDSVRVLAIAPQAAGTANAGAPPPTRPALPDTPVGESHFMAERPMNVRAGTSAMVSMVRSETAGGIVYLYDPFSDRGDDRFAFKAVRLDNPTGDTLEAGPVTVYGDGRFVGEGITEPVPPHASVVVPFALDRQIVVSRNDSESDHIAKLVTVQRGIVTAEVQHRRAQRFTVTSRLPVATKLFLRHRLQSGWTLVDGPPRHLTVGDSQLFEIDLGPGETRYVDITEATPVEKRLDLNEDAPLAMMKLYLDDPAASPRLRTQVTALLATHKDAADLVDKLATLRDQLAEYRERSGELHAQLVTLKLVRTAGDLRRQLEQRLADMSQRTQQATLAIVDAQERLMLARVKFGNQLAELQLTDVTQSVSSR